MKYESLRLLCECEQQTTRIREVGFTADLQIVLYWRCIACKRYVYVVSSRSLIAGAIAREKMKRQLFRQPTPL